MWYNDISRGLVRGLSLFGVEATLQRSQPNLPEHYRLALRDPLFHSLRSVRDRVGRAEAGGQRTTQGDRPDERGAAARLDPLRPAHKRLTEFIRADERCSISCAPS